MQLDRRETAAVLAGLRLLQRIKPLPDEISAVFTDDDLIIPPLADEEIDQLAERINVGDPDPEHYTEPLVAFVKQRVNDALAASNVPSRLVRYGLMDPWAFLDEMQERQCAENENGAAATSG